MSEQARDLIPGVAIASRSRTTKGIEQPFTHIIKGVNAQSVIKVEM
jgi:hypothetical protein